MDTINLSFSQQLADYKFLYTINQNIEGRTYVVQKKNNDKELFMMSRFSVKSLNDPIIKKHIFNSAKKLMKLSRYNDAKNNIILYQTCFTDSNYLYFIFDYHDLVCLGNLFDDLIKGRQKLNISLTYSFQYELCRQLIEGLSWIHSKNVSHGNVQPKSIWLDPKTLKPYWVDFGFQLPTNASYCSPELADALIAQDHNNPEILDNFRKNPTQQMANDVWGLGVTIYYIMTGNTLVISGNMINKNMKKLHIWQMLKDLSLGKSHIEWPKKENLKIKAPDNCNKWKQFILWILNPNWEKRPNANDILSRFTNDIF